MVRALLNGTKTQTRRVVKSLEVRAGMPEPEMQSLLRRCPYGALGDRLWVRETFAKIDGQTQPWIETDYRATYTPGDRLGDSLGIKKRWTPAIHMPRSACRIELDVTGVRVERLQDISDADAIAEGVRRFPDLTYRGEPDNRWSMEAPISTGQCLSTPSMAFANFFNKINGPGSWDANPWVWVIEFKQVKP